MELIEMIRNRRSIRKYTGDKIPEEKLQMILEAGLLAPSGRNIRPSRFIVVRDKDTLEKMSKCRPAGPQMLKDADAAIVVLSDTVAQDVWVEDASIAMTLMHLMADSLGVGSCWIQGRLRPSPDNRFAEDYLRDLLQFPEDHKLVAILSLGVPAEHPEKKNVTDSDLEKTHYEKW